MIKYEDLNFFKTKVSRKLSQIEEMSSNLMKKYTQMVTPPKGAYDRGKGQIMK
jgi:hypothetical protein